MINAKETRYQIGDKNEYIIVKRDPKNPNAEATFEREDASGKRSPLKPVRYEEGRGGLMANFADGSAFHEPPAFSAMGGVPTVYTSPDGKESVCRVSQLVKGGFTPNEPNNADLRAQLDAQNPPQIIDEAISRMTEQRVGAMPHIDQGMDRLADTGFDKKMPAIPPKMPAP